MCAGRAALLKKVPVYFQYILLLLVNSKYIPKVIGGVLPNKDTLLIADNKCSVKVGLPSLISTLRESVMYTMRNLTTILRARIGLHVLSRICLHVYSIDYQLCCALII